VLELLKYLKENMKEPDNFLKLNAYIEVKLRFIVEKNGSVQQVIILNEEETREKALFDTKKANSSILHPFTKIKKDAANKLIDSFFAESKKVVLSQPNWKAATQRGKPVRCYFTLPIKYKF
jgi:hypothetical protein